MHPFESLLSVSTENLEFELRGQTPVAWADFLLNPRRLRGSDFLMRWSQGVWSEERVTRAVNETGEFYAVPYGPSGTAPDDDVRAFELYFERLEAAGLGNIKRPDLLVFRRESQSAVDSLVADIGGLAELPFTSESERAMQTLLSMAVVAIECENSLWKGAMMPDYRTALKPQKRLGGRDGLRANAVLPTIILKEEDRAPLQAWQDANRVPIHIWHIFYDMAFGLVFDEAERLINAKLILPTEQVFQAPGGATTRKSIFKFYYHYGFPLCVTTEEPRLAAKCIVDKNGHILPYVHFEGGNMVMKEEALVILRGLANEAR